MNDFILNLDQRLNAQITAIEQSRQNDLLISLPDYYRTYFEIKNRANPVKYLKILIKEFLRKIEDEDT